MTTDQMVARLVVKIAAAAALVGYVLPFHVQPHMPSFLYLLAVGLILTAFVVALATDDDDEDPSEV